MRQHNNANMISIGAKYTSYETAIEYIETFLTSEFEGGRHILRVELIEK
jgi:ribose 5-phosphate isomerase B